MGTGKTTVGRIVAERLGWPFIDTDQLIERRHGPIPAIFAEQGEDAFRDMEREVARELADSDVAVISTGGRFMLDDANVDALGSTSVIFCLHAPAGEIVRRVLADGSPADRPLLAGPDPAERVASLLRDREAAYAAFAQVSTSGRTPDDIATEIISRSRDA